MKSTRQLFIELYKKLETAPAEPVYFFCGEEPYYIEQLVSFLKKRFVDPATFDFNFDHFHADEAEGAHIINAAASFPMMADRRFVLVDSVQKLAQSARNQLLEYTESPVESTSLVLTAGKIDLRKKLYAALKKKSVFFESKPLYSNQAADWVHDYFKSKQIVISRDGAEFLVEQTGVSLWNLHNECEKIRTAYWDKPKLNRADIAEVVGFSRDCTIWEYTDRIGERDFTGAQTVLEQLIDNGVSPVFIVMNLYQRVILLYKILLHKQEGSSDQQITGMLKLSPFFARQYIRQSVNYTAVQLKRAVRLLLQADLFLKTGAMDPKLVITGLTYEITAARSGSESSSIFI